MKKISVIILVVCMSLSLNAISKEKVVKKKNVSQSKSSKVEKIIDEKLKSKEDCDEKAKKVIEIKPESISLGGGNTGCSLEGI